MIFYCFFVGVCAFFCFCPFRFCLNHGALPPKELLKKSQASKILHQDPFLFWGCRLPTSFPRAGGSRDTIL